MRDYQTKTNVGAVPDSNTAEKLGGSEITSMRTESKTAVSRTGQTLAPQDGTAEKTDQLAKAMFICGVGAQTMVDSGAAGAYVLTPVTGSSGLVFPETYAQLSGAIFEFEVANPNAGASTVDMGQTAGTLLGVKSIVAFGGAALAGGEMTGRVRILYDLGNDRFELLAAAGALFDAYAKVSDVKASGVVGGVAATGVYQLRDINTEDYDPSGILSIAANQIIMKAGSYICKITVPGYRVDGHKARLYDATGAAILSLDTSERSEAANNTQTRSIISGPFALGVQSALEIQHRVLTSTSTQDLGFPSSFGDNEVYTVAEFWRLKA